jgi:hypothetical protein
VTTFLLVVLRLLIVADLEALILLVSRLKDPLYVRVPLAEGKTAFLATCTQTLEIKRLDTLMHSNLGG